MTDQTHAKGLTTLADYTLTYDDLKRVTTFTSGAKGTNTDTYDPISQLKDSLGTLTAAENYSYDANGNRTNSGYSTNSNDRLTSDGVSNYQSDNEGNRTRKTTIATNDYVEYTWDHRNRLVRVDFKTAANVLTKRIEYSYDAFDRRIAKRVHDTGTTAFDRDEYYAYDGEDVVLVYTDPDGEATTQTATLSHRFLHGPAIDQVFADETQSGQVFWALADHQGTVRDFVEYNATTNTTSVVKHRQFTAFGTITADSNTSLKFLYAFTGREWDPDAQLYYYRARWYDPLVGRFLSQDPINFAGGDANLYRYVGNSPTNATDPSGLETYWQGVGNVFLGYGDAGINTAKGIGFVAMHPIQTAQGIGNSIAHPVQTFHTIKDDIGGKLQSTRGQGEIVGDVLIGVATGGAVKAAKESGRIGKIVNACQKHTGSINLSKSVGAAKYVPKILPLKAITLTGKKGVEKLFGLLEKYHGIDRWLASKRLHELKQALGIPNEENLLFDLTGGVWDPSTREWLGSLTEGGARSKF